MAGTCVPPKAQAKCAAEIIRSLEAEVEEGRNQVRTLRNGLSASNIQLASLQENLRIAQEAADRSLSELKTLQVRHRVARNTSHLANLLHKAQRSALLD